MIIIYTLVCVVGGGCGVWWCVRSSSSSRSVHIFLKVLIQVVPSLQRINKKKKKEEEEEEKTFFLNQYIY